MENQPSAAKQTNQPRRQDGDRPSFILGRPTGRARKNPAGLRAERNSSGPQDASPGSRNATLRAGEGLAVWNSDPAVRPAFQGTGQSPEQWYKLTTLDTRVGGAVRSLSWRPAATAVRRKIPHVRAVTIMQCNCNLPPETARVGRWWGGGGAASAVHGRAGVSSARRREGFRFSGHCARAGWIFGVARPPERGFSACYMDGQGSWRRRRKEPEMEQCHGPISRPPH